MPRTSRSRPASTGTTSDVGMLVAVITPSSSPAVALEKPASR